MILRATTRITRRAPGLDRTIEVEIEAALCRHCANAWRNGLRVDPSQSHGDAPRVLSARDVTFASAPFPCEASWSEFSRVEKDIAIEALIEAFEAQQAKEAS